MAHSDQEGSDADPGITANVYRATGFLPEDFSQEELKKSASQMKHKAYGKEETRHIN